MHGPREVTFYHREEATKLPPDIQQLISHYGIKIIQDMRAEQMCSHISFKYCATDLLGGDSMVKDIMQWTESPVGMQHVSPVLFPGLCHLPSIFDWLQYPKAEREGLRYLITKPVWIPVEFLSLSPKLHVIVSSVENAVLDETRGSGNETSSWVGLYKNSCGLLWHSKIISWWIEGEHL